jgi:hypothetical protein
MKSEEDVSRTKERRGCAEEDGPGTGMGHTWKNHRAVAMLAQTGQQLLEMLQENDLLGRRS